MTYKRTTGLNTGLRTYVPDTVLTPGGGIENIRRIEGTGNQGGVASGTLEMTATKLPGNFVVNSITFQTGTTGVGTPTNQWFALYDSARNLLGQTTNDTTTAWAASTPKTLSFAAPFTTPTSGLYYVGLLVTYSVAPTLEGVAIAGFNGVAPILSGNSTTGLTTTAPNPAAAITAGTSVYWCSVQ